MKLFASRIFVLLAIAVMALSSQAATPKHYSKAIFWGNSYTTHGITTFWWDVRGMASTVPGLDFANQIGKACADSYTVSGSIFELDFSTSTNFSTHFPINDNYDAIILQFGENINYSSSYTDVHKALFAYLTEKCPKADIYYLITSASASKLKAVTEAANGYNVTVLNCSSGTNDGHLQMGDFVTGSSLTDYHAVNHSGVVAHPSDVGMHRIANKVLTAMGYEPQSKLHAISFDESATGCSAPYSEWVEGGLVNISASADIINSGGIAVKDADGKAVATSLVTSTDPVSSRYVFIMPASAVTVYSASAGVNQISADTKTDPNAPVYNITGKLMGHSTEGLAPGIYIRSGKKIIVK